MKITSTAGHNVYNKGIFDPGAVKYPHVEAGINKEAVSKLIPLLRNQGHEVLDATPYNQKFSHKKEHHKLRCKRVDEFKSDLYLDIHMNSGGGEGVECWVYSKDSKAYDYAEKICQSISKEMNIKNRGVKVNPNYWSVSLCKSPAIIVEGAFVDSVTDMKNFTAEKYALAIAKVFGEVKEDKKEIKKEDKKESELYRVQVGAFSKKENAENTLKNLKDAGFEGFIKNDIIEESKNNIITNPNVIPKSKSLSKYYETKNGLKVIETIPSNLYVARLKGKTLRQVGVYGINGTFQNNKEAHLARSIWGLLANKNGIIGPNSYQNSPKGHKKGTLIYYQDRSLEVKRINNIKEITKPIIFAVGGGTLLPDYNPKLEGTASDILRTTAHTGIGFKGGRVFLFVHKKCSMLTFKSYVEKELKLDQAIFLDGGGSTQMNYTNNRGIYSSRPLSNGIFLKEVH